MYNFCLCFYFELDQKLFLISRKHREYNHYKSYNCCKIYDDNNKTVNNSYNYKNPRSYNDQEGYNRNRSYEGKTKPIKNQSKTLETISAVHQKTVYNQIDGTCYAHAIAQAIISAELRIIGRPIIGHWTTADQLINRYGINGSYTQLIIVNQCSKRGLKCNQINENQAEQALKENRVVIVCFYLSQKGWRQFQQQTRLDPEAIVEQLQQGNQGHAAVIVGIDVKSDGKYWRIKNSWGKDFGIEGIFKVKMHTLQLQLFDVFLEAKDLPSHERLHYQKYSKMPKCEQELREKQKAKSMTVCPRKI